MLNTALLKNATMEGRSVEMKIIATGGISDAYDMYVNVHAHTDRAVRKNDEVNRFQTTLFLRFIYWQTTHKKLVLGTVSVMDAGGLPSQIVEEIEKISSPVEIKDYWKKAFEKHVVVQMATILKKPEGLMTLAYMWQRQNPTRSVAEANLDKVLVYTIPVASYEAWKRNSNHYEGRGESLDHKCYEGPHGFVRSDKADDFDIPTVTSFPVTELVV